ncbi:amidohydrolase [Primorskyibacter sp. S87]|uniref:amidohydrolase n=1 Tax=Primorskyibacter sp. S87 TaxID=3415126 RepID=UPI003C7B3004
MTRFSSFLAATFLVANSAFAQSADIVFTTARVLTVDETTPTAEAVAVTGNKITYVGDVADAEAMVGDNTEVFDLGGDSLLPGFASGHDHIVASDWTSRGISLFGVDTLEEALATIKDYADANPDEELILGYGFDQVSFGGWPTKEDLESVVPDRPAFILDFTIHDVWMNSKAFDAGKVDPDESDQVPGVMFWQRDAGGKQTGIGIEFQLASAFRSAGAWDPAGEIPDIQKRLYDQAVKTGITAVHVPLLAMPTVTDLSLVKEDEKLVMAHLHELEKKGDLSIRTFVATGFKDPNARADEIVGHTLDLREQYDSGMLRIWEIKIHPEGNWSSQTTWMMEPYTDGTFGGAAIEGSMITSVYLQANMAGLPVGTHVDGSQTVRNVVNAIMTAREAGYDVPNNLLHHYFWVSDLDHETVIGNEIMVNTTPIFSVDWETQDVNAPDLLGRARVEATFARYSSRIALGHNVSISSDVPSSPIDLIGPLLNVEIAMTLQDPLNEESKPFPLSRKPASLEESLKAVTIYPAAQQRMEDKIGSMTVGKYADLVVPDQDITQVIPGEISNIKVLGTIMDGRFTHREGL